MINPLLLIIGDVETVGLSLRAFFENGGFRQERSAGRLFLSS